jgi:hypothetical protein
MNAAIHVSTAPVATAVCGGDFGWVCSVGSTGVSVPVGPPRLVINEGEWGACGIGVAELCGNTHSWSPAEGGPMSSPAAPACGGEFGWLCAVTATRAG